METKKILIVAVSVLTIAVVVLFYLHFKPTTFRTKNHIENQTAPNGTPKMVYFDMDSLENNFAYLKKIRDELRILEQQKSRELANMREVNKNKLMGFQKLYQEKGNRITEEEVAKMNQELAKLDNDYKIAEQTKAQELNEESIKKIQDVKKKVEDYLKEYNVGKNYAVILSAPSDNIYYIDPNLNITAEIIKGLNEKYKISDK